MTKPYADDVTSIEAWQHLSEKPTAILIDVRSDAEWQFVGVPDLNRIGKPVHRVAWQNGPSMVRQEDFVPQVQALDISENSEIYLLCRSGQRSAHAAAALTEAGYTQVYNISDGFEGPLDQSRHRGRIGGWKCAGLDWIQS